MSGRLFYSDPLAAAWMAKQCGMRFQDEGGSEIQFATGDYFSCWENMDGEALPMKGLFFVHPNSQCLLALRVGDSIIAIDGRATTLDQGDLEHLIRCGLQRPIIRRDGKPFFWPESEAA